MAPFFTCSCCNFKCISLRILLQHARASHSHQLNFKVKCGLNCCPSIFAKYNSLYKHTLKHHKDIYHYHNNDVAGNLDTNSIYDQQETPLFNESEYGNETDNINNATDENHNNDDNNNYHKINDNDTCNINKDPAVNDSNSLNNNDINSSDKDDETLKIKSFDQNIW